MDFIGIQILALIFGLVMMFLTYYSLRKREFSGIDFALWLLVWLGFTLAAIFPMTLKFFLQTFGVISVVQLFSILGMMFIFVVTFYLYKTVRKNKKQIEEVVKKVALEKVK